MDGARGVDQGATVRELRVEVALPLVFESLAALGAESGYVATVDPSGEKIDVARVTEHSRRPVNLSFDLDAPYPLAETIRTRAPLLIPSNHQLECEHPGLVRVKPEDHACATLPLFDGHGELLGAINIAFDEPKPFSDAELELIDITATHCAEAMTAAEALKSDLGLRAPNGAP